MARQHSKAGEWNEGEAAPYSEVLEAATLREEQDKRFLMNASNLSLQSQTVSLLGESGSKPDEFSSRGLDKAGVAIPDIAANKMRKVPDPKADGLPDGDRGAGAGGVGAGLAGDKPDTAPPTVLAPVTEKSSAVPGGPGVGHPVTGATPESRRDRLDVPLRVGSDEEKMKEMAKDAGVEPALVTRPLAKFDEELWVISRLTPRATLAASRPSPSPGAGTLWLGRGAGTRTATLREFKAEATITGPVASVTVSQRFANETSETVDGVYVLPMPRDAAVTDFVMTVGSGETQRKIRGVIRERAEAERIFLDAQKQGRVASLMGEDAANVLVQRIGNIAGGATVGTSVTYFGTLEYAGIAGPDGKELVGAYEFVLPMRGVALAAGGVAAQVTVTIDAGLELLGGLGGVMSPTHAISSMMASATGRTVTMGAPLAEGVGGSGGDFVLRYAVAGSAPRVGMVTQSDGSGAFFSMLVTPPVATGVRPPMDVVIVPDIGANTTGATLAAMRNAAAALLSRLGPSDRFAVAFGANDTRELMVATPEAVAAAIGQIASMEFDAGRSFSATMRGALASGRGEGARLVCVLSRGEISEGLDVIREARVHLGAARIFAVSVDEPAGFAGESLARIGRGGVIHLSSGSNPASNERLMARLLESEGSPVMTDMVIDWGGAEVTDVFPRRLPDLCPGRPVHVVGRLLSPPLAGRTIGVTGTMRGGSGVRRETLATKWGTVTMTPGAIATLWARAKVLMLGERLAAGTTDGDTIRKEIVDLALNYNLVSAMTAFVAVDAMSSVEPVSSQGSTDNLEQATNVAPR